MLISVNFIKRQLGIQTCKSKTLDSISSTKGKFVKRNIGDSLLLWLLLFCFVLLVVVLMQGKFSN